MANDLSDEQRFRLLKNSEMYEKGLVNRTFAFGEAPKVTPRDLTIDLPVNMQYNHPSGHAYGELEQFVEYLRTTNHIPAEAQTFFDNDRERGTFRVKFEWWTVEGWTKNPK